MLILHGHKPKPHHGGESPTYTTWRGMIHRCKRGSYVKLGVTVTKRWMRFKNFLADMGERPSRGHEIDRKNPLGNYTKRNCQWILRKDNRRNRRDVIMTVATRRRVFRLASKMTQRQIAALVGCHPLTIGRLLRGESWT